jgi:malate permease and related proteins
VTTFTTIFLNNILPAFLVMAAGVVLDRVLRVDKRTLSRTVIYVLTPCLVFSSIVESTVDPSQFGRMILFVLVLTAALVALALAVARALGWSRSMADALVLSTAFVNAGNFGLPVILFSFGDVGLELATVFYVASSFTCNSVAAFFAARGNGSGRTALLSVLRLPGLYAFALALLLRLLNVQVPNPLLRPVELVGRATVPILLMMLGLQLSQTRVSRRYGQIGVGVVLRLVVGALVGLGLAPLLGLEGLARSVAVTEAATPTAVNSALMAIEFGSDAEYVTSVIFCSTLLSGITLTILLSFLT